MANSGYNPTEDKVIAQIETALKERIAEAKERVIKAALEQLDEEIREAAGKIAINLANYYSVERYGADLRITIYQQERK